MSIVVDIYPFQRHFLMIYVYQYLETWREPKTPITMDYLIRKWINGIDKENLNLYKHVDRMEMIFKRHET